ncbi:MAG TPA: hypothetical protein EYP85_08115, partial [Armatimonadetes bacterium]|nr:hypothetical protein [Armatimonadota bacterium]
MKRMTFLLSLCLSLSATAGAQPWADEEECAEQFVLTAVLRAPNPWPRRGEVTLAFNLQPDGSHYAAVLRAEGAQFYLVRNGQRQKLGSTWPLALHDGMSLTLQRRKWRMRLWGEGLLLAEAYDETWQGGTCGWRARAGLHLEEWEQQPVGDLYFADDFVRTVGGKVWETLQGKWLLSGVKSVRPNPRLSANPFSFAARAKEESLAVAGYWFWSDYTFAATVKPEGLGAVGLAVYVQDEHNYLLFRWAARGRPKRQLVRVRDGQGEILARAEGGFVPGQWYRLAVTVLDGWLTAAIDGQPVLAAEVRDFGQGRVGLYAAHCERVTFDDVRVESADGLCEDFHQVNVGKWRDIWGTWHTQGGVRQLLAGPGLTITGRSDWQDAEVKAEIEPQGAEAVGLCFGYHSAGNYYLFRWGGSRQELVRLTEGREEILAACPAGTRPRVVRLRVRLDRGYVQAAVNGQPVLETVVKDDLAGQVGVFSRGLKGTKIRHFWVTFPRPLEVEPPITEQFAREATMAGWASPRGAWQSGGNGWYWHKGRFFGEAWVRFPPPTEPGTSRTVVLGAEEPEPTAGYRLEVQRGEEGWRLSLHRQGMVLAQGELPLQGEEPLEVQRRGHYLILRQGSRPVWAWAEAEPLSGRRIGVQLAERHLSLSDLHVGTNHLLDDTFSLAPWRWWVQTGDWEVRSRWPCAPGWAWFGGAEQERPLLWSKASFQGDLTVEAYLAFQMKPLPRGYPNPRDLNLTICGDGRRLASGYSFVFAGWGNTASGLWRREEVVARNPRFNLRNPTNFNNAFHRHWFYLRVEKTGPHLRYFVDDQPVLEYTDAQPLTEGRVAFWTWDNGLMLARARVWYEALAEQAPPLWSPPLERALGPAI